MNEYRCLLADKIQEKIFQHWENLSELEMAFEALQCRKTSKSRTLCSAIRKQIYFLREKQKEAAAKVQEPKVLYHVCECSSCGQRLRVNMEQTLGRGFVCKRCKAGYAIRFERDPNRCPFQILGVPKGANRPDILRAYHRRVQEYHPDRLQGMGEMLIRLAEEELKRINLAFEEIGGR